MTGFIRLRAKIGCVDQIDSYLRPKMGTIEEIAVFLGFKKHVQLIFTKFLPPI